MDIIEKTIMGWRTKYKDGFTSEELEQVLEHFGIEDKSDEFTAALGTYTCAMIDKEFITFHHDVILGVRCVVEDRSPYSWEMD